MYPPPSERLITRELAQRLDDQFFTGDPSGYFRARLRSLVSPTIDASGTGAERVKGMIGPAFDSLIAVDSTTVEMQTAVDALALRHHVAESLLRLLHALLHVEKSADSSVWVALTDTPMSIRTVMRENRAQLDSSGDPHARMGRLLLPEDGSSGEGPDLDESIAESRDIHIEWVNFSIKLMVQQYPDINGAHNKLKHGPALRPQTDHLTVFSRTPPNEDGTIEASALNGPSTVRVFDGVTAEFIARPKMGYGLELTHLRMDVAATIAEAGILILTHALLFHHAAMRHFGGRGVPLGRQIAPFPGRLVGGPRPGKFRGDRPFAMRFPLSLPLRENGSEIPQLFWTSGVQQDMTFGPMQRATVVDTPAPTLKDSGR